MQSHSNPGPLDYRQPIHNSNTDDTIPVEGSILGGILGGGAGGAASRGDGMMGNTLGVVSGSMIGCQIDGGNILTSKVSL